MEPTEQQAFIQQAAEPVAQTSSEPDIVYAGDEPTPAPAPVQEPVPAPAPSVNWEERFADVQKQLDAVTQENNDLKYNNYTAAQQEAPAVEPVDGAIPDQYAEPAAFAEYLRKSNERAVADATQPLLDRLSGVELIQGQNILQQGLKDCKSRFPDLNEKEANDLIKFAHEKSITITEAKKLKEFDKMEEQLTQYKSGVTERLNTPQVTGSTTASHTIESRDTVTLPTLTPEEKTYAARRKMSEKDYAMLKYTSSQRKVID